MRAIFFAARKMRCGNVKGRRRREQRTFGVFFNSSPLVTACQKTQKGIFCAETLFRLPIVSTMAPASVGQDALVPTSETASVGAGNISNLVAALEPLRPQLANPIEPPQLSYLSSSFAAYPTGAPGALGAFLSCSYSGAGSSNVLLDYDQLSPMGRHAMSWLSTSSLASGGVLLEAGSDVSFVHGPAGLLAPVTPGAAHGHHSHASNISGVFCNAPSSEGHEGGALRGVTNGVSGNTTPLVFLLVLVLAIVVLDLNAWFGFQPSKYLAKLGPTKRSDPTGSTGEPVASSVEETGFDTKISTTEAHLTEPAPKGDLGKAPDDDDAKDDAKDDSKKVDESGSPTTITWHSWMIICFTVVPVSHCPSPMSPLPLPHVPCPPRASPAAPAGASERVRAPRPRGCLRLSRARPRPRALAPRAPASAHLPSPDSSCCSPAYRVACSPRARSPSWATCTFRCSPPSSPAPPRATA